MADCDTIGCVAVAVICAIFVVFLLVCGVFEWVHMAKVADGDPYGIWGDPEVGNVVKEMFHIESWGSWEGTLEGHQDIHTWTDASDVLHINIIDGLPADITEATATDVDGEVVETAASTAKAKPANIKIFVSRESPQGPDEVGFLEGTPQADGKLVAFMVIHNESMQSEPLLIQFVPDDVEDLYMDIESQWSHWNNGDLLWNPSSRLESFLSLEEFQEMVGDLRDTDEGSTLKTAKEYHVKDEEPLPDFGNDWIIIDGDRIGYYYDFEPNDVIFYSTDHAAPSLHVGDIEYKINAEKLQTWVLKDSSRLYAEQISAGENNEVLFFGSTIPDAVADGVFEKVNSKLSIGDARRRLLPMERLLHDISLSK